ncbi:MAG: hypothetical protein N3I86_11380, partial [Verrucomicrobiae bacterium]|nr:hypothetical protein [Verrucomicrobiae bacterium]
MAWLVRMEAREIKRRVLQALLGLALVAAGRAQQTGGDPVPPKDIRVVQGKEVDVTPVHRWLQSREGERPLSHWQRFQIIEIKRWVAGHPHCLATSEKGESVEILVANLPHQVRDFLQRYRQLQQQVHSAQLTVEREQRRLEEIDATVPAKTGAPSWYEDAWTRRRYQVDLALVRVKHAR